MCLLRLSLACSLATILAVPYATAGESVTITPSNPAPVLGVDDEVELVIRAPVAVVDGPPRVLTSVGRIDAVSRLSANEFAVRFVLPDTRFPQVALIAVQFSDKSVALGFLSLRLRALTKLSFRTDPDAQVTLVVGDRELGPQAPDRQGEVTFAVAVAPGITEAKAKSQNIHGKITEQAIDLAPPPFPRLLMVAPERLAAGNVATTTVFVIDERGAPGDAHQIHVTTSNGRAHPLGGAPGQERFLVRAPGAVDINFLTVTANLRSVAATTTPARAIAASFDIALVPGPPASLELRPDRPRLPIGSGISMWVMITARDLFGNRTDADGVELFANGERSSLHQLADAQLAGSVPAPDRYDGRVSVQIDAVLAGLHTSVKVPLSNFPPLRAAPKAAHPVDPNLTLAPRVAFVLHGPATTGLGVLIDAHARRHSWPDGVLFGIHGGYLRTHFSAQDGFGRSDVGLQQIPILATGRFRVRRVSRLEIVAQGGLGVAIGGLTHKAATWEIKRSLLGGAGVVGIEVNIWLGPGMFSLGAQFLFMRYPKSLAQDGVTGNAGGLVFDVGYQFGR